MGPLTIFAVLAAGYVALYAVAIIKGRRLRNARKDVTAEHYFRAFDGTAYRREAIVAAYDDLQNATKTPILRFDDLEKTLGFVWEDFDDLLDKRLRSVGLDLDRIWHTRHAKLLPVQTVDDYVRFLSSVMEDSVPREDIVSHDRPPQSAT